MASETIGLIAGNGKFPFLFARAAREQISTSLPPGSKDTSLY